MSDALVHKPVEITGGDPKKDPTRSPEGAVSGATCADSGAVADSGSGSGSNSGVDSGLGLRADFRPNAPSPRPPRPFREMFRTAAPGRIAALAGVQLRRLGRMVGLLVVPLAALGLGIFTSGTPKPVFAPTSDATVTIPKQDLKSITPGAITTRILATPIAPNLHATTVALIRGDTLAGVLEKAGATRGDAAAAISALVKVTKLRRLRPGQVIEMTFEGKNRPSLSRVMLTPEAGVTVVAWRGQGDTFSARKDRAALTLELARTQGVIKDSLFLSAERAGLPAAAIVQAIRMFSFDVDFQREVRAGDHFDVFYERFVDREGAAVKEGNVLYAALTLRGRKMALYRFRPGDDRFTDYFNAEGHSAKKALMRTPIDGARLTSRYGRRKHPILGYRKMHRGIDFGARRGTPIMAAGDGTIRSIGRNGGYGNYIRIRHNGTYSTAYAHMRGFARGLKRGSRVRQGQIIGYVGSTGRSTGPHLHYEVHANGRQVNPLGVRLPTGRKLKGRMLADFQLTRTAIQADMAALAPRIQTADAGTGPAASAP